MKNFRLKLKKNKGRKIFFSGLLAFFLISFLVFFVLPPADFLEVDFLDVGQGDASLIKTPFGQTILIDGGPDNSVLRRLGENLPFYRRRLDLVIVSHYHEDHITGLVETLRRYQVKKIIYTADSPSSALWETLWITARRQKTILAPLSSPVTINFGPACSLFLLPPSVLDIPKDPNNSLLTRLTCRGKIFLFSGDNSLKVESVLLKTGLDLSADVFKVSHHGANSANSVDFLTAVRPGLAVISVGADNRFGHPAPALLARLEEFDLEIKRTDKDGTVKVKIP